MKRRVALSFYAKLLAATYLIGSLAAACTSPPLTKANIQGLGQPISNKAILANGILGMSRNGASQGGVLSLRDTVATFLGNGQPPAGPTKIATVFVGKPGVSPLECIAAPPPPPAPPLPSEACVRFDFLAYSTPLTLFSGYTIEGKNTFSNVLVISLAAKIANTPFQALSQIHGGQPFTLSLWYNPADPNNLTTLAPQTLADKSTANGGLYFHGALVFDSAPVFDFTCNCSGGSGSGSPDLPFSGCATLCALAESKAQEKGGHGCDTVPGRIKLNRTPVTIGLQPKMPAPNDDGTWTTTLFTGAKNFHLPTMFQVNLVAGGNPPQAQLWGPGSLDVITNSTEDVAVGVDGISGCNSVCSTDFVSCEDLYAQGIGQTLQTLLPTTLGQLLQAQLGPLFNFSGAVPKPCNITVPPCNGPGCCAPDAIVKLASASLTYLKWDWFAGAFGPYPNGSWLTFDQSDQTAVSTSFPAGDAEVLFHFQNDWDGDGILNPDDNCWQTFNTDQLDSDCDGLGDACDGCKLDPQNDADHDFTCGNVDNCPGIYNLLQSNANPVAEDQHGNGLPRWGDSCDPVPVCVQQAKPLFLNDPNLSINDSFISQACGTSYRDFLSIVPLRSNRCDTTPVPNGCGPVKQTGCNPNILAANTSFANVQQVPTSVWFCQRNISDFGIDCGQPADITTAWFTKSNCAPTAANQKPCAAVELKTDHFHRTDSTPNLDYVSVEGPNAPPFLLDYTIDGDDQAPASHFRRWLYANDFTRWKATGLVTNVSSQGGLNGTLAIWTDSKIGDTFLGLGTGQHGEQMSVNYSLDFSPERFSCAATVHVAQLLFPFFLFKTLPDPGPNPFVPVGGSPLDTQVLVRTGSEWAALRDDGTAQVMTSHLGTHLLASLGDASLTWAGNVDPVTQAAPAPLAVALGTDGSQLVDTMTFADGKLLGALDRSAPLPVRTGSPHANGYAAVYSAFRDCVFVVGGTRPVTGEPTHEIWFSPLSGDRWSEVKPWPALTPENVLAASYSPASDELVILDETLVGLVRLWAVSMRDSRSRILAASAQLPQFDRHDLVIDRDGALLVALSSNVSQTHVIARLDLRQEAPQFQTTAGARALALPPVVSRHGYALYFAPHPNAPEEVVAAANGIRVGHHDKIHGDLAVTQAKGSVTVTCDDDDDCDDDGPEQSIVVRHHADVFGRIRGDSVRVQRDAMIHGAVAYNALANTGSVAGDLETPLALPLVLSLPPAVAVNAAAGVLTVGSKQHKSLEPGSYGAIKMKGGSVAQPTVLTLARGDYDLAALELGPNARVECTGACSVRIAGRLSAAEQAYLGPSAASGAAADVVFLVTGSDADDERAAKIGKHATVRARLFVPNGTLSLGANGEAMGTFFAKSVVLGHHVTVRKDARGVTRSFVSSLSLATAPSFFAPQP